MPRENARVLGRTGARELTMEEIEQVSGGFARTHMLTGSKPNLDFITD
jgi:hypothetical protein